MGSTTALNFYHTPFAIVGRRGQPECEDGRRAQGPQNSEGKREKFLFFFGREEEKKRGERLPLRNLSHSSAGKRQRSEGGGSTEQIFQHVRKMPSLWSDDWSADSSLSSNSTPVCPPDTSDPDATERSSTSNASVLTKVCRGFLPASDDRCRTKCLKKAFAPTAGGGSACDVGTRIRARCALLLARTAQGC